MNSGTCTEKPTLLPLLLFGSPQQLVAKRALVEQKTHDFGQPDEPTLANNREGATNPKDENVSDEGIDLEDDAKVDALVAESAPLLRAELKKAVEIFRDTLRATPAA